MESAAKKKNSLAMGVIGTMIVWASALLFSSAANASSASHVGQKSRAEVSGPFTAKTVAHLDANPINATRYYDALEGVALECTVAPVRTVPQGHTRVYRAVSEAEYQQILQTGKFEVPPGRPGFSPMNGKWFADSAEGAVGHGNSLPGLGKGKFRIIEADVPDNAASLYQHPNMDGLGPARYLDINDLNCVQPRPVR